MEIDPIIYIVAASVFSIICGLLAFRTVAGERRDPRRELRHLEQIRRVGDRRAFRSLKDVLAVLVGMASGVGAIFSFYKFVTDPAGGHTSGWIALGLAAVAFVCGLIYFMGHVSEEEEIHIT
jgi:hypothetical protein